MSRSFGRRSTHGSQRYKPVNSSTHSFLAGSSNSIPLPATTKAHSVTDKNPWIHEFLSRYIPRLPKDLIQSGWRGVVTGAVLLSSIALIVNLVILYVAASEPSDPVTGAKTLSSGPCSRISTAYTGFHLAINILSTLLLASSNATMQCLSAPTRKEVDAAHSKEKWLDIGISSLRNWRFMSNWRRIVYILLAASSLPLHLFYNSVIFPVNPAYAYNIYQVTQDWVDSDFRVPTSSLFKSSIEETSSYEEPPPYYYPESYYSEPYDDPGSAQIPKCATPPNYSLGQSWVPLDTDPFFVELAANANSGQWKRLTPIDCFQAYSTVLQTQYSNLFLIFNESKSLYGSISGTTQWPTASSTDAEWGFGSIMTPETILPGLLGGSALDGQNQPGEAYTSVGETWLCDSAESFGNCGTTAIIYRSANWTFEYCSINPALPNGSISCENAIPGCWPKQPVDYCLAQPVSATCSIQVSVELMAVVIVFNSVKIMCFVFTLWKKGFTPLVTLGDGMRSFLMIPDDTTKVLAPVSAAQLRKRGNKLRNPCNCPRCMKLRKLELEMWREVHTNNVQHDELFGLNHTAGLLASSAGAKSRDTLCAGISEFLSTFNTESFPITPSQKQRWFRGASLMRWLLTYSVCTSLWITGLSLLSYVAQNQGDGITLSFPHLLAQGLESANDNNIIHVTASFSIIKNVLIANSPQVIASIGYVLYNQLLTCLLVSREFTVYSVKRAGLRVTTPQGDQRSTFWLSLPYKFSMPLLGLSTLLHWALSQTIFLTEIEVHAPDGSVDITHSVGVLAWSALALVIILVISIVMMLGVLALGFLTYPKSVPIIESNSFAISTACHRLPCMAGEENRKLRYGIISSQIDGTDIVGLSSGPVRALGSTHKANIIPEESSKLDIAKPKRRLKERLRMLFLLSIGLTSLSGLS